MPFECPGFVDFHTHLLRTCSGTAPPWGEVSGVRSFHEACCEAGTTPVDDLEWVEDLEGFPARLLAGLSDARALGLVEIWEAGMRDWAYLEALLTLRERDVQLPVRVRLLVAAGLAERGMRSRTGDEWCDVEGVKFYSDGWLGTRTCAVSEPFSDESDNSGILFETPQSLARRAAPLAEDGWTIATHAIGDRAVESVLDAYELIFGDDCAAHAPRIEHVQVLRADLIERMAAMGVVACIQPGFATADEVDARDALSGDVAAMAYRWDLLVAAGVPIVCGSDYPIDVLSPLVGLWNLAANPFAPMTRTDAMALMSDARAGVTVLSVDPTAPDVELGHVTVVDAIPLPLVRD
jgi:predicted amidohydrolase YtcJ